MATPSRSAAAKAPVVHFSIEDIEKEIADERKDIPPFGVRLKSGDVITLIDPELLGWQRAAALDTSLPFLTMQTLIDDEEAFKAFKADDFSKAGMQKLITTWRQHYGLPDLGE